MYIFLLCNKLMNCTFKKKNSIVHCPPLYVFEMKTNMNIEKDFTDVCYR